MNVSATNLLRCIAVVLVAAWLGGCASGMGKDECAAADWRMIGYEDGVQGLSAERIGAHRVACAKHSITPNLAAYTEGRDRGLREYCRIETGFRVGLAGRAYGNVCTGPAGNAFVSGYRQGREIHDARSELRTARSRLRSAQDGLASTDAAIQSATAEVVAPNVAVDRRTWLATELVRLAQERTQLIARIDQLTVQANELALNVRELERQSPYPI